MALSRGACPVSVGRRSPYHSYRESHLGTMRQPWNSAHSHVEKFTEAPADALGLMLLRVRGSP